MLTLVSFNLKVHHSKVLTVAYCISLSFVENGPSVLLQLVCCNRSVAISLLLSVFFCKQSVVISLLLQSVCCCNRPFVVIGLLLQLVFCCNRSFVVIGLLLQSVCCCYQSVAIGLCCNRFVAFRLVKIGLVTSPASNQPIYWVKAKFKIKVSDCIF